MRLNKVELVIAYQQKKRNKFKKQTQAQTGSRNDYIFKLPAKP